jgi:TRAP-type mannitol/chloroaromatic compound transport system permease small subunit
MLIIQWLSKIYAFNLRIQIFCASTSVLLAVSLTFEQVIARYFFDASNIAMQELELVFFAASFLLALAPTLELNRHVCVDILSQNFKPPTLLRINILGHFIFLIPTAAIILIYGLDFASEARTYQLNSSELDYFSSHFKWLLAGERSQNPNGLAGVWLIKCLIPLTGVQLLITGAKLIYNDLSKALK